MHSALRGVVWGVVLATSLASGQERTKPQGEVSVPSTATEVRDLREQAEALSSRCYAEYWYENDPLRRVRLLGKPVIPAKELGAHASAKSGGCPRGYVCECGGTPFRQMGPGLEVRQPADASEGSTALGFGRGGGCPAHCQCVPKGRFHTAQPEDFLEALSRQKSSTPRGPLLLKLGPDTIVTLSSQAATPQESKLLILSGPSEVPLDEAAVDLSTLDVGCKAKARPRSGRRPR